jgi:hypothetical protein
MQKSNIENSQDCGRLQPVVKRVSISRVVDHFRRAHLMKAPSSMRLRASRFLGERYVLRERPTYFADLILWALIIITAAWPIFSLAQAMETLR